MRQFLLIGIGAGLAAAALYSTVITYSLVSVLLFYLAPLPLFIAGLGWGAVTAGIGALTGTGALAILADYRIGLLFLLSAGVAPVALSHLALLSRPAAGGETDTDGNDGTGTGAREWYPEGRLVLWAATLAGVLVSFSIFLVGTGAESFYRALREIITEIMKAQPAFQGEITAGSDAEVEAAITLLVHMIPPASAVLWLVATLANLWLATRVLKMSGREPRPWAPFSALDFPPQATIALGLVIVLALLTTGTLALISGIFAAVAITVFAILGLAVVHALTQGSGARPALLAGLYAIVLLFNWIAVIALAGLGLAEAAFGVRNRWAGWTGGAGPGGTT
ncbi:DUF2232 domain-containing protein [Kaustia mangrovi]|uniref:DUF2232 domain-containing protein n=1 Tax=Kaustia mangrovi TaxID=2593653 RepID=A0A7S8C7A2_9HYPH|nr:DUF2232 domain-containing protein [Kaustia mangrovi]QPC44687.1 DUF2232 domain-containing protein [Kaustia mangrovi]